MRTISAAAVTDAVAKLCIQANTHLPPDIVSALDRTRREEPWPLAKETLGLLWDNLGTQKCLEKLRQNQSRNRSSIRCIRAERSFCKAFFEKGPQTKRKNFAALLCFLAKCKNR